MVSPFSMRNQNLGGDEKDVGGQNSFVNHSRPGCFCLRHIVGRHCFPVFFCWKRGLVKYVLASIVTPSLAWRQLPPLDSE